MAGLLSFAPAGFSGPGAASRLRSPSIIHIPMVRDGYFYGGGILAAAALIAWLVGWPYAVPVLLLAAFFLWFFRDPERDVPAAPGTIVSPADGKVTAIAQSEVDGVRRTRLSIFLNVFNVHVNRAPTSGVVRAVEYKRGRFGNAMGAISSDENEQNIVTVEGEGHTVIFKQIAGLLARRIVFTPKVGDVLERGQRVGLIKFGSRVDVVLGPDVALAVKLGDQVKGGSSVLGQFVSSAHASELEMQSTRKAE
jgi:phosphatidylserine decarboxylase